MCHVQEIHIYHSDSSDVQQANTPVSALSDVHQGGLRAVSLYKVLSRGGALAGPRLREEDHSCSQELAFLTFEFFISHNWQVDRWRKFLTLVPCLQMLQFYAILCWGGAKNGITFCILKGLGVADLVIYCGLGRGNTFQHVQSPGELCHCRADLCWPRHSWYSAHFQDRSRDRR